MLVQAPKSDIYVVMLGIALGAIFLGCLLLILVLNRYEFKTKVSTLPGPTLALASVANSENTEFLSTVRL